MFLLFPSLAKSSSWILSLVNYFLLLHSLAFGMTCNVWQYWSAPLPHLKLCPLALSWLSSLCPDLLITLPSPLYQMGEGVLEGFVFSHLFIDFFHPLESTWTSSGLLSELNSYFPSLASVCSHHSGLPLVRTACALFSTCDYEAWIWPFTHSGLSSGISSTDYFICSRSAVLLPSEISYKMSLY